jgi:ABC-2 type transport system ATP-binding protein
MDEVLKLVELGSRADDLVQNYSGGMRRRLELARSLLHYPKVLFLDEPTIGLDPQTRKHIWDYIRRLARKERITILLTTHYLEEADALCDRIAIMDEGRIVVTGTPEKLKESIGGDVVRIRCDKPRKLAGEVGGEVKDGALSLTVEHGDRELPRIFRAARELGVEVESAHVEHPSLDDVFLKFTGKEMRDEEGNFSDMVRAHRRNRR